jgi:L-threonylcarbamoyladenylate synthase
LKETRIVKVNPDSPDIHEIRRAASIIKNGGLVAFPTETVYGLGADGLRTDTVDKIFLAKGRPQDNPLILHVASPDDISRVATEMPPVVDKLVQLFWPGPLTLVLPKRPHVPDVVSGGLPTIGVRMPDNIIALTLIAESGMKNCMCLRIFHGKLFSCFESMNDFVFSSMVLKDSLNIFDPRHCHNIRDK